jgi:hypothetical protein
VITALTIAAAIGVYSTHMTAEGWMFGTLNGSVAIIALLAALVSWLKIFKKMCGCRRKGCGCGSGCEGGKCGCPPGQCNCK